MRVFRLLFPPAAPPSQIRKPAQRRAPMRHKILLIEDDDTCRASIVRYLVQKGYAVSVAESPSGSQDDVLDQRFDAVVIGISQAGGRGTAFIKGVREYHPSLPI